MACPCVTLCEIGNVDITKSGVGAMVNVMLLERASPPPVPFTASGYAPTVTVGWAVTVIKVLAFGVNGFAPKDAFAPLGKPDTSRVTGALKPFSPVIQVVYVMGCPCTTVCEIGVVEIEKSGDGLMDSVIQFVRVMVPELLVTVNGKFPVSTVD